MDGKQCMQTECEKAIVSKSCNGLKKEKTQGPDGGMAWIVAFACCMINFIMAGLGRMSGILFVAFIEIYGVDRKSASMPFSVRSSAGNLFGPIVGILGQKYGARKIIVIGGVVGTISSAACFFAPDVMWITVLWGVVNGLGSALTVTLPQVVIGQYFDKHRTTAAGIAFSGGCVGSFVFPMLLEYLLDNFGIEGTFLIIGAVIMHTIPAALILKKPSWLKVGAQTTASKPSSLLDKSVTGSKDCLTIDSVRSVDECTPKRVPVSSSKVSKVYPDIELLKNNSELVTKILTLNESAPKDENQNEIDIINELVHLCKLQRRAGKALKNIKVKKNLFGEEKRIEAVGKHYLNMASPKRELPRVHSKSGISLKANEQNTSLLLKLSQLLPLKEQIIANLSQEMNVFQVMEELLKFDLPKAKISNAKPKKQVRSPKKLEAKKVQPDSLLDHVRTAFKLYGNPLFLMVCLCRAVHFIAFIPAMTTVVDFCMDKGLHEEEGKFAIAAISMGDLLGRLCFGWVTDRAFMTLPKYMMAVMIAQGMSTASLPMMNSKIAIFSNLALFGMLQGSLFVRHPVLISKYMKSNEQSIAMGCVNFISGIIGFGLPIYIGFFRDTMGSYDYIFYLNGLLGACVGLL